MAASKPSCMMHSDGKPCTSASGGAFPKTSTAKPQAASPSKSSLAGWIRLPVVRLPDCGSTRVDSWTIFSRYPLDSHTDTPPPRPRSHPRGSFDSRYHWSPPTSSRSHSPPPRAMIASHASGCAQPLPVNPFQFDSSTWTAHPSRSAVYSSPKHTQTMSKPCRNHAQTMPKLHETMLWACPNHARTSCFPHWVRQHKSRQLDDCLKVVNRFSSPTSLLPHFNGRETISIPVRIGMKPLLPSHQDEWG
jgi:hypothetical protein